MQRHWNFDHSGSRDAELGGGEVTMRKLILLALLAVPLFAATCPSITSGGNTVEFCTSGTSWSTPAGVTVVTVETVGGGGGGSNQSGAYPIAGSGGGGGGYAKTASLSISGTVAMTIGGGGTGTSGAGTAGGDTWFCNSASNRSEEHTSELQSLRHLVCRL